jgi:hypothetical protein
LGASGDILDIHNPAIQGSNIPADPQALPLLGDYFMKQGMKVQQSSVRRMSFFSGKDAMLNLNYYA